MQLFLQGLLQLFVHGAAHFFQFLCVFSLKRRQPVFHGNADVFQLLFVFQRIGRKSLVHAAQLIVDRFLQRRLPQCHLIAQIFQTRIL